LSAERAQSVGDAGPQQAGLQHQTNSGGTIRDDTKDAAVEPSSDGELPPRIAGGQPRAKQGTGRPARRRAESADAEAPTDGREVRGREREPPAARSAFPRLERAYRDAEPLPDEQSASGPTGDPFGELLELRRRHTAAHAIVLDRNAEPVIDMRRRERIYRRSLAGADVLAALLAVLVAIDLFGGDHLRWLYLLVAPLIVLAAKVGGLYDKDELLLDHSTLNELPRLLNLATMFALLIWLGRHYVVIGAPTTMDLLMLWLLLTAGIVVARTIARELARRLAPEERCLLVGRRAVFERLNHKFHKYPRVRLVGVVKTAEIASDHIRLRQIAERDNIHRIIIDTDATSAETTLDIVRAANVTGLQVSLLPSLLGAVGGSVVFDDIGGLVLMGVPRFGLSRSSYALKRTFDLLGASIAVVVLAPAAALLAVAIKLDSRGPVLFRQTRVGRDGTTFQLLKFRTMIEDADRLKESLRHRNEAVGLFKIEADPRITRIGRLLRRTGIDELPQLLNVLAGDMSLVGPRPLVLDEDSRVEGFDRHRLHLTPGITGRWQTLGAARVPLAEMVKIDYLYIANWSPWADIKIILETVKYVVRGRGQ
jgi:exopolysaccharide biosynthesis polyprenyl glycosylphosphotransferase